jgi:glycerol-3-phosphate dehydrogenase
LIGTTDSPYDGDPSQVSISSEEKTYLLTAANRFLKNQIDKSDIFYTYSGVRSLYDDGQDIAQKITRDYKLDYTMKYGAPLLSVFGGKLTTYRKLAHHVMDVLKGHVDKSGWTQTGFLPGGDITDGNLSHFIDAKIREYSFLPTSLVKRYARSYGTRMDVFLTSIKNLDDMGRCFGGVLYEAEIAYLIRHEFAKTSEDILRRRTKLYLHMDTQSMAAFAEMMPDYIRKYGV